MPFQHLTSANVEVLMKKSEFDGFYGNVYILMRIMKELWFLTTRTDICFVVEQYFWYKANLSLSRKFWGAGFSMFFEWACDNKTTKNWGSSDCVTVWTVSCSIFVIISHWWCICIIVLVCESIIISTLIKKLYLFVIQQHSTTMSKSYLA